LIVDSCHEGRRKKEEGSATDLVTDLTDLTDRRKAEVGRGKKEEGRTWDSLPGTVDNRKSAISIANPKSFDS
jgi:hypothetical protein